MLAFLLSPLGKIAMYVVAGLTAITIVWGAVAYHDSQVKQMATYEYNQKQLEQTVKDQADQISKLRQTDVDQQAIVDAVSQKNNDLNQKTDAINNYISNQPADKNAVSPIIIDTLNKLKVLQQ